MAAFGFMILGVWASSTRHYVVGQAMVQVRSFTFLVLALVLARAAGRMVP